MRKYALASLLMVSQAIPVLAAGTFFVVVDAHGYCSVTASKPDAASSLKVVGDASGYASKEAAIKALKDSPQGQCKNIFR